MIEYDANLKLRFYAKMSQPMSQTRTSWHRLGTRKHPWNGGEGGIRTPGTFSGTTDFESVTFGLSATSPKKLAKKSSRRTLASLDYRSVSDNSSKSCAVMNIADRATLDKIRFAR